MLTNPMSTEQAVELVASIASRWGENVEEGFTKRITATMTDAECEAIADESGEDKDDVLEVRNLWRAQELITDLLKQRGCEHFDAAVTDGKLTTLCDVIVFG